MAPPPAPRRAPETDPETGRKTGPETAVRTDAEGMPDASGPALDRAFAALADPTRRAILRLLLEDDMAVTDVAAGFPISLAAVSRHLQVLAEAGLIAQERRGRITWCKLLPDSLREAQAWMAGFGLFEAVDLDAFERFLEAEER